MISSKPHIVGFYTSEATNKRISGLQTRSRFVTGFRFPSKYRVQFAERLEADSRSSVRVGEFHV
jgi:hypothetical protein